MRSAVRRDDAGTDALPIVPGISTRTQTATEIVDHGSGIASFPAHTRPGKPCNSRADAIATNDQIRRHCDGLSAVVKNNSTTDTIVNIADQCGQCAAMPNFRSGRRRGIHKCTVQQCPARRIKRLDPMLGSDPHLHDVFAVNGIPYCGVPAATMRGNKPHRCSCMTPPRTSA